jgi:hypothetical protein
MRRGVLGAAVGVGVGGTLVALAVIATTGWLLPFIIVPAVAVVAAIGFAIGWQIDRRRPGLKRFWAWLALAIVAWPLCYLLPIWARDLQIRWLIAHDIPEHPGCMLVERSITTYGFDDSPGYSLTFTASQRPRELYEYYRDELATKGWEVLPVVEQSGNPVHEFRKPGRRLSVTCWRGFRWGDTQERSWVSIHCCLENLSSPCPTLTELGYPPAAPDRWYPSDDPPPAG